MRSGSSPRGRGTHRRTCQCSPVHPRAGGEHTVVGGRAAAVHPRAGGEHGTPVHPRAGGEHRIPTPVHPRAGGEHGGTSVRAGTSAVHPRAGGEHTSPSSTDVFHAINRFIPARAGNTPFSDERIWSRRYPGSSPRGRGTRLGRGEQSYDGMHGMSMSGSAVHPRAGGEQHEFMAGTPQPGWGTETTGSSPRGRGTQGTRLPPLQPVHPRAGGEHALDTPTSPTSSGSSPRGRTPIPRTRLRERGSSPRGRGTHRCDMATWISSAGSSPRGRGTPLACSCSPACAGSSPRGRGTHAVSVSPNPHRIPARAGNTGVSSVHPRAGGEHQSWSRPAPGEVPRFIPARAGNTWTDASGRRRPVHPRAGGEHVTGRVSSMRSPRFIPARAGNTERYPRAGKAV